MKRIITNIVVLLLSFSAFGNDGTYLSKGGVIYPVKETKISLDKEILSFTVKDKVCRVDIMFEFNNPENIERKLLIGFQAPMATGDIPVDLIKNRNQITDFKIISEGRILPYKIKVAECEDCELKEPEELDYSESDYAGINVYLFEITFKPGINKIQHSYLFPASSNVVMNQFYNYILKTGAKWANGTIKDLTVLIDIGENKYFYITDIFGKSAEWAIIGTGKVTEKKFDYIDDFCRMIRVLSGKLQISVKNFKPLHNLEFGIINEHSFITYPTDYEEMKKGDVLSIGGLFLNENYTKDQLKILRNTVYAQYGYNFKDTELQKYFSQFEWYLPDPNLKMEDIILTKEEKLFIEEIITREKNN